MQACVKGRPLTYAKIYIEVYTLPCVIYQGVGCHGA